MTGCNHTNLVLIREGLPRVRCRHCHLTIRVDELGGGCCPECREGSGRENYDFEPVEPEPAGPVKYRCEDCGALIEA